MIFGLTGFEPASAPAPSVPAWQGRSIGTTKLRLVEFSAFLEQQRDPDSVSLLGEAGLDSRACFPFLFTLTLLSLSPLPLPLCLTISGLAEQ